MGEGASPLLVHGAVRPPWQPECRRASIQPSDHLQVHSLVLATRRLLCLACCLLLALLAGCEDAESAGSEATLLVVAARADGYGMTSSSEFGIYPVNANLYETLVRLTPDYQIEPWLATGWEFRPPNTWRFRLRQGVRMHDGSLFTAEAVRWSMARIAAAGGGAIGVGEGSVEIIDNHTVDITPVRTNLRLLQQLAHPNWSIVAPGTEPAERTIGTGPVRLVEYVKGNHVTVERFDDYWGEQAGVERITFRFLPDANTRVLALRSGQVDVAYELPREAAQSVAGFRGVTVARSPVGGHAAIYVNRNGEPPYDLGSDPAVRRALAHAIDKGSIVGNVWSGNAEHRAFLHPGRERGAGPHFDRFIDGCRAAVDAEEVRRNAAEAMRLPVDEERVVIPLAGTYRLWGLSERVTGFATHPSSLSQRWESVSLAR
jgi:ABC-type transport system substrate-binding protein